MFRNLAAFAALAAMPTIAHAQETVEVVENSGDTAWILVSAALVLLMTLPGLGLFYGGLVRAKNFLSVFLQVGAIAAVASVLWVVVGYTLAFGDSSLGGWLGGGQHWMLENLDAVYDGLAIPESTFALFQMTFAAITPALMVGAWVERARFSWVVLFCAIWGLVVYAPVAHWIWGGGWLAERGALDFAGGMVVHTTAGVSAVVIAMLLGKRQGFPGSALLPHAPGITMLGSVLLWVGWFGFNGGSALSATADASNAILNTHVAASVAAMVWILIERISFGKPTTVGFATGAIAGLATITPAAGFVSPGASIVIGAAGSIVCYYAIQLVKMKLHIDDSLDVFAVHGVGGMLGSILLGVFMSEGLGGAGYAEGMAMGSMVGVQVLGVVAVGAFSAILTVLIALGLNLFVPMRISEDDEVQGLDITSHGERGWEFD
ncbi:ammonium transporter [Alteraurantiacibacter aquimixticola]|uniref:Ammonium transporter n=1 Tax=Alteraurantiacibacter aquimixticola TaxID=2489173 RepID=A0A4T3F0D4_9SPHN|nr:ammonium transporter [Alteraurantiacibacter aquimixticola]TIX49977.1 ammonium transporter [Alteraurantiacibacter aquimixticola]